MSNSQSSQVSISLIIPAYNRGDLIAQTIHSALNQSVPFCDIVVVDDGSTDNTAEILRGFGDRVRVLTLSNGGVQIARNRGVEFARGDYVTFCDSDDLLEPNFVDKAAAWLGTHPETDVFYCNFVTFTEEGVQADKFSQAPPGFFDGATRSGDMLSDVPDLYLRTMRFQPLFMSGCLVKKSFYQGMGGFDTAFTNVGAEDWEFTLRAVASGKVALCTTVLARVRKHIGNESADTIRQVLGTVSILEHALKKHPLAQRYRNAIGESIEYRRHLVFQEAFARARFELAHEMLALLGPSSDPKFRLKVAIMKLPAMLRGPAWRLTQR